ncbi:hypothetical protein AWB71_00664 [Caballeronia peredens]|nr:hypothetical protein AWB71_00664 [Caballeronia peredens]
MSFPEWGYSYNALYVPLSGGWHCALMPIREVPNVDREWRLSFEERKQKKRERQEQIEKDRQDFERLFELRMDRREAAGSTEFKQYVEFINRHLRASSWDLRDGEGVTRVLRDAVRDKLVIPVIARNWHGGPRVFRRYAPQDGWRTTGGSTPAASEVLGWREFAALKKANGETGFGSHLIDSDVSAVSNLASRSSGAVSGDSGSKFDWSSVIDAAGGALAGATLVESDRGSGGDSMLTSVVDADNSLLNDAQPFDYQSNSLGDVVTRLAARGVSEAKEAECFADYEIDMEMCSAASAMYQSPAYYLECKARAFQRYQQCRGY